MTEKNLIQKTLSPEEALRLAALPQRGEAEFKDDTMLEEVVARTKSPDLMAEKKELEAKLDDAKAQAEASGADIQPIDATPAVDPAKTKADNTDNTDNTDDSEDTKATKKAAKGDK